MVDARRFASRFIKPDQVRDSPIVTRVVNVFEDERYNRLMLELEIGSQFALNDSNTNILIKAWGADTDAWHGNELSLELGTYKDWRSDPPTDKETVRVRPVTVVTEAPTATGNGALSAKPPPARTAARPSLKDQLDDSIPF